MAKVRDNLKNFVLDTTRTDKGMQSEYLYGTLNEYDPATHLSTVEILGTEIVGVPKLAHVTLGGWWEPVASGHAVSVATVDIDIPREYIALRIHQGSQLSDLTQTWLRFNNDSGLDHRRGFVQFNAAGSVIETDYNNGSVWYTNRQSNTVSSTEILIVQGLDSSGDIYWQFQSYGKRNTGGATSHSVFLGFGRLNDSNVPLESVRLGVSGTDTYDTVNWTVEGQVPYAPEGRQVLCVRSSLVPLTIIGVLDGATTD